MAINNAALRHQNTMRGINKPATAANTGSRPAVDIIGNKRLKYRRIGNAITGRDRKGEAVAGATGGHHNISAISHRVRRRPPLRGKDRVTHISGESAAVVALDLILVNPVVEH